MTLRNERVRLVAVRFGQRRCVLLVVHVGDALEEEEREDVALEVGCVDQAVQDVGARFRAIGLYL